MSHRTPSRRQILTVAAAGAAGLSGCLGDEEPEAEPEEEPDDEYSIEDQPEDAAATFVAPDEGATVSSPVQFEAEVEGIELAPAGDAVVGEGHLHLLVDGEPFETGEVIPGPAEQIEDEQGIYHWGDGSSEGEVDLEGGEYTIVLQIADGPHRAYGETDEITITVENGDEE